MESGGETHRATSICGWAMIVSTKQNSIPEKGKHF